MENNLTEKDIEVLNKWAEKYYIEELKIKDKEKIFNLKGLYIGGRGDLTELPKEIGNLTNLKRLIIKCFYLKELPKEIFNLINLEELHISSDNLTELPKEIGNLTNLKSLDIDCYLNELPKEIYNLINLEKLSIRINNLEISPDGIEKLINLENLYIDINIINENFNFKSLPIEEMGKLNNLKEFDIRIRKEEK